MPSGAWLNLILLVIAAAGIGAFLYTLAARIAWEIGVHQLRVETHRLRVEYAKRLARLRGDDTIDASEINVDILDDQGNPMDLEDVINGEPVDEPASKAA
ncbi:MAG: hypothetical protein ACIAQF_08390 [Phycisphaerales bacterium JB065]